MVDATGPFDFGNGSDSIATPSQDRATANTGSDGGYALGPANPPHTIHTTKSVVDSHGRILNPRSCVTCRKRKVRCDKSHPCANCSRAHIECVFPNPGRAPRRIKKPAEGRDAELLARLRRLEGVVKGLGVDVIDNASFTTDEHIVQVHENENENGRHAGDRSVTEVPTVSSQSPRTPDEQNLSASKALTIEESNAGGFENRFGRLVINEGRSRYVNSSFWANLSNEVEDLKGILNDDSDDDNEHGSPSSHNHSAGQHQGWIFGFSSLHSEHLNLHPDPTHIKTYWNIFKERVDPLAKVLHLPSIEPTVLAAASHLENLARGFEALLFAIYYGAATSLSADECITHFGEERNVLLPRYRFGVEQALARANFLISEEMVVLQAFVIFLVCLRRNSDAKVIWTLTGLLVRIAMTIGIHRDGTHFGLSPFEVELRRRLWWQVCILDVRASEDHGCDPTITEQQFDTRMPLNINDCDIAPSTKVTPKERQGCTDMSFCLIRFEVANTFRRINYVPPGPKIREGSSVAVGLEDKELWIKECHEKLEEKYLRNCDMRVPLYWITATVARLMMSKMWLMVYHPFQRRNGGANNLSAEVRNKLFITSLENIEYSLLLETESRTLKWGWLIKTYMQWHALAFLLSELCIQTRGELVDRAWIAVDRIRSEHWREISDDGRRGHLWRPLNRLISKASAARNQALLEDGVPDGSRQYQNLPGQRILPGSTADLLHTLKQRPKLVAAPLSQAQLSRFMTPVPAFGTRPIDTTKLLQSPTLTGSADVGPEVGVTTATDPISNGMIGPIAVSSAGAHGTASFNTPLTSQPLDATSWPYSPYPQQASDSLIDKSSFQGIDDGSAPQDFDTAMTFDTEGNINWQSWDQLVRQFEMDMDQNPVPFKNNDPETGGNTSATQNTTARNPDDSDFGMQQDWGNFSNTGPLGPNTQQNMGMSMGMGGNGWF